MVLQLTVYVAGIRLSQRVPSRIPFCNQSLAGLVPPLCNVGYVHLTQISQLVFSMLRMRLRIVLKLQYSCASLVFGILAFFLVLWPGRSLSTREVSPWSWWYWQVIPKSERRGGGCSSLHSLHGLHCHDAWSLAHAGDRGPMGWEKSRQKCLVPAGRISGRKMRPAWESGQVDLPLRGCLIWSPVWTIYQGVHGLTSGLLWVQTSLVLEPHLCEEEGRHGIVRQVVLPLSYTVQSKGAINTGPNIRIILYIWNVYTKLITLVHGFSMCVCICIFLYMCIHVCLCKQIEVNTQWSTVDELKRHIL